MAPEAVRGFTFRGNKTTIPAEAVTRFSRVTAGLVPFSKSSHLLNSAPLPLDMAFILGWKELVKPLFPAWF